MSLIENRWMRAAVPALLIHCSIGSVYCWSSFSAALSETIGVSGSLIGWAFSLAIFFLGMSAAFAGNFVEKNIHASSFLSCVFFTVGMVGTGLCIRYTSVLGAALTVAGIFLFYGCIMGIGLGIGYLTPVKTLMLWFDKNKGLATGISIMGFGLAKAIASPAMNYLQTKVGLANMFFILAAVYFLMMITGHLLLKKPDGWVERISKNQVRLSELVKNKTFVGIWLMFYINITCGLALISYEKSILLTAGFGVTAVSVIQSISAASNALGRIGFSTISDMCRDRNTIYKIIFAMSATIVFLTWICDGSYRSLGPILVVALMILINAGYGGGFSTLPALLSSRFGMNNISRIHGLTLSAWAFAGLTGNQITALVLKYTDSYTGVLAILLALYVIGFLLSRFCVAETSEMYEVG